METESDLECTCDIGPFSSCPACRSQTYLDTPSPVRRKEKAKWETQSAEDRIAEIKAGYMR